MTDQEIGDLIKRLKGLYSVGKYGICEDRYFGTYTPVINKEAANLIASQQGKIAELEKELVTIIVGLFSEEDLVIRDLEQQAKGVEDAVTKLERPDVTFAPCLILNDDLLDFAGELRNQAKALKEKG